jgi:protein SCO1/2
MFCLGARADLLTGPKGQLEKDEAHHHHHKSASASVAGTGVKRIVVQYQIPDVTLVNQDGKPARLKNTLTEPGPVYLNFIFTSCTTVCPVMSQIFYELQSRLGPDDANVRLVSVSIDPLEDTPRRLSAYSKKFAAGANWEFLTGTGEASIAVQRAFDVYRGDKMNHPVASFFRRTPNSPWVRLEGFASADQLLAELRRTD